MFVVSFENFKSRALSRDPSGGCMMTRAKVHVRAQASRENITVLSHLKDVRANCFFASLLRTQIQMPRHTSSARAKY